MQISAGLLLYKKKGGQLLFFLVHPGGPFFKNKDDGFWTIPKGLIDTGEDPLAAALREFEEETGIKPDGNTIALNPIKQKGGKTVMCWAMETDIQIEGLRSYTFELEWPPKSGKKSSFPEIDRYGWFEFAEAKKKINERQIPFLEAIISL